MSDAPIVQEVAMLPRNTNAQEPIDNFPAIPLPKPDASMDLSMLGAGETTTPMDAASRQVEDNRKAKLKALHWAEAEGHDLESDSSQDLNDLDQAPHTANQPHSIRRPQKKPAGPNAKAVDGAQATKERVVQPGLTKRGRPSRR